MAINDPNPAAGGNSIPARDTGPAIMPLSCSPCRWSHNNNQIENVSPTINYSHDRYISGSPTGAKNSSSGELTSFLMATYCTCCKIHLLLPRLVLYCPEICRTTIRIGYTIRSMYLVAATTFHKSIFPLGQLSSIGSIGRPTVASILDTLKEDLTIFMTRPRDTHSRVLGCLTHRVAEPSHSI